MINKSFRTFLYLIAILLILSQSAYALNIVRLSPEYFPNSSIGRALSSADIYVGKPDLDPKIVANQKQLSVQQEDGTIVAVSQPISTSAGGVPQYLGSPVTLLVEGDYSLKVLDSSGSQIYYVPSTAYDQYLIAGNYYYPDYTEADQGIVGGGNSVADILAEVGTVTSATMYFSHNSGSATTTYTFATSEIITDNFNIIIEDGALLSPSTGKTLTINGPFSHGLYQAFSGSGTINFGEGATQDIYPQWWGAVGDGTTDDTAAMQAWANAGPGKATHRLTSSIFRITSTLSFAGDVPMKVIGCGIDSIIKPDIDTANDAVTLNFAEATYCTGHIFRDFAIMGGVNSCKNNFHVKRTYRSIFENIWLLAGTGADGYGLLLSGSIYNKFRLIIHDTPLGYVSTRPHNGVRFIVGAGPAECNVNKLDVIISNVAGKGVYITSGTGVEITGSVEATGSYGIHVEAGTSQPRVNIHNMHLEINGDDDIFMNDIHHSEIGPNFACGGGTFDLDNCDNILIRSGTIQNIEIDSACQFIRVESVSIVGGTIQDSGIGTSIRNAFSAAGTYQDIRPYGVHDKQNLFYNSNFERWQATLPDGWDVGAGEVWTKCGTGLGDTTNHISRYCAKQDGAGALKRSYFTHPDITELLAHFKNSDSKYGSFSIWGNLSAGTYAQVIVRIVRPGGDEDHNSIINSTGSWGSHKIGFEVPSDATDIDFILDCADAAGVCYWAEPTLFLGIEGTNAWSREPNEHNDYFVLGGKKIVYGAAAPAAGWWDQGDICFNTGAAAGGKVGWVCVTAGTPGTWKAFGVIDA